MIHIFKYLYIRKLIISFLLIISVINLEAAEIKIGVLYKNVYVSEKEAVVASKIWNKYMTAEKYDADVKIVLYDSTEKLFKDYSNGKILLLVMGASSYYKNKSIIDKYSESKWVLSRTDEKLYQYYIIKNSNSILTLDDLKDTEISYKEGIGRDWVSSLALKSKIKKTLNLKKTDEEKKLVFNVFFNKNKFSVISKHVYELMGKLNPQVFVKTKIVKKSKAIFPLTIGFDRVGLSKKYQTTLEKIHADINNENKDIKSLSYMNVNKLFYIEDSTLEEYENFYKEFYKLKEEM